MAITYHAGRRLQGLSTDRVQTLTFEDDFSSDGWTDNDSTYIGVSGGSMNWNCKRDGSNDASVYDLTSTSANWILRFKLTVTNVSSTTGAGNGFFVGLSDSNQTAGQSTSQDFIGMSIYNDNTDTYQTIDADGATVPRLWEGDNSQTTTYNTGSIYYYQIIKTGSSYTVEGFTGSDYSTGSIGSISGTSSASGLRYIKILNETDTIGTSTNPFQGTINALKFYDGVTSITSKPTNVQVGSRFEETDTRKMYHYNASADITTDGSYTVLQYKSDGTFTPTSAFNVEYLVVAGGGGGAGNCGGGGGSGGYRTATGHAVTAQSYGITVGGAGIAGLQLGSAGDGGDSTFDTITSNGGGGGSTNAAGSGAAGGSGGGTGGDQTNAGGAGNTPSTSPSQGNNGGAGYIGGGAGSGGGGGGSTAVGVAGVSGVSGAGGAGTSSSITGSAVTRSGGGGAGECHNGSSGAGGTGGGGAGGDAAVGNAATVNTGSGGGGGGNAGVGYAGGSGGSGIVILRFLTSGNTYTTSLANVWTEEGT